MKMILTFKKMLQQFPVALAQVNAGKASHNSISEIRQIIFFLYQSKEIQKLPKFSNKSNTVYAHQLPFNLEDNINLKRGG